MNEHTVQMLSECIQNHEDWLMERILAYAVRYNYAQYTSTLKESWRMSISGLSTSILASLKAGSLTMELGPDDEYAHDPVAAFGIQEGRLHRERGIDIGMFLGLLKYYRQSYTDLIDESDFSADVSAWLPFVEQVQQLNDAYRIDRLQKTLEHYLDEKRGHNAG